MTKLRKKIPCFENLQIDYCVIVIYPAIAAKEVHFCDSCRNISSAAMNFVRELPVTDVALSPTVPAFIFEQLKIDIKHQRIILASLFRREGIIS